MRIYALPMPACVFWRGAMVLCDMFCSACMARIDWMTIQQADPGNVLLLFYVTRTALHRQQAGVTYLVYWDVWCYVGACRALAQLQR